MIDITPDSVVYGRWGPFTLNATLVFTWVVMALLVIFSRLATRRLVVDPEAGIPRWQNLFESIIAFMRSQIEEIAGPGPDRYLPFLGTLFLFISVANFLEIVPGYRPPTGSLSTTGALAICVFFAVPIFGIARDGARGYLSHYVRPSFFMLPFHIIGEVSRTLTLAVRLFGNIMSEGLIVAVLLTVIPLVLPVVLQAFALLIGQIQAYIFAILAAVYIASASQAYEQEASGAEAPASESENDYPHRPQK